MQSGLFVFGISLVIPALRAAQGVLHVAVGLAIVGAGGWRDKQMLLDSYQRADDETIKTVVLNPTMRLAGKQ